MFQRNARKFTARAALCAAVLLSPLSVFADDKPDKPLTDEAVVASMIKAADYLLAAKKGDNWETDKHYGGIGARMHGGESALVLYALLHAGDSLQDNTEYHSKLHYSSKELAPAVQWMCKNMPDATYTSGLEASALTLLPKRTDDKAGEGPKAALDSCRWYAISAMGKWGGYNYTNFNIPKNYGTFEAMWTAYCKTKANPEKADVDGFLQALYGSYLGPQLYLQEFGINLKNRMQASKDPAEVSRIQKELQEIQTYLKTLPPAPPLDKDFADAKRSLDLLQTCMKKGVFPTTDPENAAKTITKEDCEKRILGSTRWLEAAQAKVKGFYPTGDLSNGQYGTLGAWALADFGLELPNAYWVVQDRFWRGLQQPDGSWAYDVHDTAKTKDTMGVAGIASLFVCQEFTDNDIRLIPKPDKNIDNGLAWLNKSYQPGSDNLYYMYGVERVGLASGLKFFGTTNWYLEGAKYLVKKQKADGSWALQYNDHLDAAYALLFLARGRNPVIFNKLQYDGPWNARPRDDAYLTRTISKRYERPINWQSVNLQVSPDEWLDAPILLITGSVDPKFTKADLDKLRTFVNAGGMIFSTADGNASAFTNAIKKYASELVDKKYEMRVLPKNHDLFSKELGVELPNPPSLTGMSNGIREIWIHSATDLGADWQLRKYASKTSFELGAALYVYSCGMASPRNRLQPLTVAASTDQPARSINVALIDYPGNANPEPGAWQRMAKLARLNARTTVTLQTTKFADLDAKKTPLAHLTGTTRITFTDADAAALKAYTDAGGLVFIDAAAGNADFAASAQALIKQAFPSDSLAPLPPDSPILTGSLPDGAKLQTDFRKFGNVRLKRRITTPELTAIIASGKTRVLFSPWDITSGFLGTNTWGIIGYTPATSEALGQNILLLAAQNP